MSAQGWVQADLAVINNFPKNINPSTYYKLLLRPSGEECLLKRCFSWSRDVDVDDRQARERTSVRDRRLKGGILGMSAQRWVQGDLSVITNFSKYLILPFSFKLHLHPPGEECLFHG